jgi:hypothetical protein
MFGPWQHRTQAKQPPTNPGRFTYGFRRLATLLNRHQVQRPAPWETGVAMG